MRERAAVSFIAWSRVAGRSTEIAEALGGEASCIYPAPFTTSRTAPLRYIVSSVRTALYLLRRRPRAVIATNPPVFPGLLALAYGATARVPVALDSHPSGFGVKGDRVSARLLPVHRWMARRCVAVLVTTRQWADQVDGWGGKSIIVHEAPAEAVLSIGPPTSRERPCVLFVGTFANDEPVDSVIEAARVLDSIDVLITGDVRRAGRGLVDHLPSNVTLVGFVPFARYVQLLEQADVVVSLTTEPTSIMRAAYEAVYAGRPLVVSDWPELRALFPAAVFVANDAAAIAQGIAHAVAEREALLASAPTAREAQLQRWECQRRSLEEALSLTELTT